MKTIVKLFSATLFAVAFAVAVNAAPLDLALSAPVDASAHFPGAVAVVTIRVLSIDYQTGVYRFQLLDATGTPYDAGAVCGIQVPNPSEASARADILAALGAGG